ncbi:DUF2267 domain-containing protein [Chloroflexota bacterium]
MDYQQFVSEVQQRGRLPTSEEAEAVTYCVLRAVSEVLPRARAKEFCACLPSDLSSFLEPRCAEPDSLIDSETFIGWLAGSFDTTALPDRSLGGTDLMAFYSYEEAARRCRCVFGVLKSYWESRQCRAVEEFLPGDVKAWFAET